MEMTQSGYESVIGIDVSKAKLDIAIGLNGCVETIVNDASGIRNLVKEPIINHSKTLVVVEATGGYKSLLVDLMHAA